MSHQISPATNITNQPTAMPIIYNANLNQQLGITHEWSTNLYDCFSDCGECIFAYFCPYCYMISLFTRANEDCCSCIFGGLIPLRTKIRTERGIKGSIFNDACALCWCQICALLQMGRELKNTRPLI